MHESHKVASSDLGFHDHDALNRSKNDDHSGDLIKNDALVWSCQVHKRGEYATQHMYLENPLSEFWGRAHVGVRLDLIEWATRDWFKVGLGSFKYG